MIKYIPLFRGKIKFKFIFSLTESDSPQNTMLYFEGYLTDETVINKQLFKRLSVWKHAIRFVVHCVLNRNVHIATTHPTTQNNLKQLLLVWYYNQKKNPYSLHSMVHIACQAECT
jgi:hypothetical protein